MYWRISEECSLDKPFEKAPSTRKPVQMSMHGQPNTWRIGAGRLDSMPGVGRNEQPISRHHCFRSTMLPCDPGCSLQQADPLILLLIIPETRRRDMTLGNDPLNACLRALGKDVKSLPASPCIRNIEDIWHFSPSMHGRAKTRQTGLLVNPTQIMLSSFKTFNGRPPGQSWAENRVRKRVEPSGRVPLPKASRLPGFQDRDGRWR